MTAALGPPGFDLERRAPVCEPCARAHARRWTCRLCGVVVCDCNVPTQYLDGGCRCRDCERWLRSPAVAAARYERLGLPRSAAAVLAGDATSEEGEP